LIRLASISLRSAGITSPPSRTTMSPGTSLAASIFWISDWRSTLACLRVICCNASMDRMARSSVPNPMNTLTINATRMAIPSRNCPRMKDIPAAAARSSTMRFLIWAVNICHAERCFAASILLGPYFCKRQRAWFGSNPSSECESRCSTVSSAPSIQGDVPSKAGYSVSLLFIYWFYLSELFLSNSFTDFAHASLRSS
jgi:hypothetical protein